jgi:catechol 2,3-dioxygenase-like lactoylglutathione lyase family enzyme
MLWAASLTIMLPVTDVERSRKFYVHALGLLELGHAGHGLRLFGCESGRVAIVQQPQARPAEHAVASFEVDDLGSAMALLADRGVRFEEYEQPERRTVNKVCVVGGTRTAWFKDPDGNLFCLHERP